MDPRTSARETPVDREESGGSSYADMWGCRWYMPQGGHYFDIGSSPLAEADTVQQVEAYPWPRGDDPQLVQHVGREAASTWREHGRAVVLGRTCPGIFEMCLTLCGYQKAMLDLAANPAVSEAIMEQVLEHKIAYYGSAIQAVLGHGPKYLIVSESDDLGSQSGLLISPEMYRRFVKPRHARLFAAVKACSGGRATIELHCCGAIRELLPDLIESGVEVLNPVQVSAFGMDTAELKREFGDRLVFHGGGVDSHRTLPYGTPEEVREEVRRRIEELAPGGGFIFTPVHSIQHDVPFENFRAMMETFYEFA